MDLRDLFNDRRWHHDDLQTLQIVVRHRGAPGDRRTVFGGEIVRIVPTGLVVTGSFAFDEEGDEGEDEVFLPFHRVLEVRGPDGVLWTKPDA